MQHIPSYLTLLVAALILLLTLSAPFFRKQFSSEPFLICLLLLPLAIMQVLLCKLTASNQVQPVIILSHLMVGLAMLSLLWWISRITSPDAAQITHPSTRKIRPWAWVGLALLVSQIMLGAWVPTNFANVACDNFPYCNGQLLPAVDAKTLVALANPMGKLDSDMLINIHLLHRIGILITAVYLGLFCMFLLFNRYLYQTAFFIILFLGAQISLNIINMNWQYPVKTVLGYDIITIFLLLSVVTLLTNLYRKTQDYWYG
jgi:cytochrome c oxidase assembly protein subunit 15